MAWLRILLAGDAQAEVEAADPLTLAGNVTIVGAGKSLELINLKAETATELTIAAGTVTRTQIYHTVDTEADAASDNLDLIAGGSDGLFLLIRPANDARTVVVQHNQNPANANNILLQDAANYSMGDIHDMMLLVYDASLDTNGAWVEVSRGFEAAAASGLSDDTPAATDGATASAGVGTGGSRSDHVHALGPLVADLEFAQNEAGELVLDTYADVASLPSDEVAGQVAYATAEEHAYLAVPD